MRKIYETRSSYNTYLEIRQNYGASQVPVAHACNPSYSGGRDQEDRYLKPYLKKTKKGRQSG
jgi:hypothetical protein